MDYTTVIVTRNRPEALELSLPLILAQTYPTAAVVIVDSSDDPVSNEACVAKARSTSDIPITYIRSAPGMTVQRNIGLAEVASPVVLFPDDDSLLYPDTMAQLMEVYIRDTEGRIGGVCSAEAKAPPPGVLKQTTYDMTRADRLRQRIAATRFRLERALVPDPFLTAGQNRITALNYPDWIDGQRYVQVEWMTGFRMSFRTEIIRQYGFKEVLGRYALFEDNDACLNVLRTHGLVGVRTAQIYHHKAPARRSSGYTMGAIQILNRFFILANQGRASSYLRRQLMWFSRYKLLQYRLARSDFGRSRLQGAKDALRCAPDLLTCPPADLASTYLTMRENLGLEA